MSRLRAVILTAILVGTLGSSTAFAKASLQAQLSTFAAWTDNVLSAPDLPPPGQAGPQSDVYFEIKPGLIFSSGTARAIQRLAYFFTADLFATHSEANSYNHRLEWAGFFLPSKTTELLLGVALTEGRLNTFNLSQGSSLTPILVTPPGGVDFFGATASENFNWDITAQWRLFQTLNFNAYVPFNPRTMPDTYQVDQHLVSERAFRKDAFGFDLRIDVTEFTEVRGPTNDASGQLVADGVVEPEQRILITGAVAKWRHDFGHFWNLELNFGFVETNRLQGGGVAIFQPAAKAAFRFLHDYGQAELSYDHTVMPNPIVAQTFALDQVALRGAVPLGLKSHVSIAATVAYQHGRVIDFDQGGDLASTDVVLVDGSVTWAPRREIQIYARYQYFDQVGHQDDFLPEPSFTRHNVLVGAIATWPGEAAATVPTRQALRVDRSDAVGIPAPHSELPRY